MRSGKTFILEDIRNARLIFLRLMRSVETIEAAWTRERTIFSKYQNDRHIKESRTYLRAE